MHRPKILLILSPKRIAASLKGLLLISGYEPFVVHSIDEARGAIINFDPEVVLLDTDLGDGKDPCAFARAIRVNTKALIIVRHPEDQAAVSQCIADAYIASAATPQELLRTIGEATEKA